MNPTVDIISIGHLSRNPYWGESEAVRPPLATTTLVRAGETTILVDPSLPAELLERRLHERSGLRPERIDLVFLTSFNPNHRRGIHLFDDARWLIGETERTNVAEHLNGLLARDEPGPADIIESELELLGRLEPAPDLLRDGVHLFPCPGVTAGLCGLLVAGLQTVVVAGDAVLTREHFLHGDVGEQVADREQALRSLSEMYEIADLVVCGHDNLIVVGGGI
jgi:glyoxylase-like metal-dependent hydrolase (beta-lactamase superfamily II)